MALPKLIYNSPFEHEKWVWRNDYIIINVFDEEKNEVVSLKKYFDEDDIIYLSNPFTALGENLVEFNKCITGNLM
ncbi:hypothetical protein [Paenibacillus sp.]|uniref:hypothetical protein n=1 Tax=Paenibacillus sp. TaxID=58172 RepID=UPI002D419F30|nr:hypothetical protein [Paenibacillus sp.]HZG87881.1 hypothetical protein [Paenibacillus sp.]